MIKASFFTIILSNLVLFSHIQATSLQQIISKLAEDPIYEKLDYSVEMKVESNGLYITSNSHIITDGNSKVWMEIDSPQQRQRIIRNGQKVQVTNLATGDKTISSNMALPNVVDLSQGSSLLASGSFEEPVAEGNLLKINRIANSDSTISSQSIYYSLSKNIISKIQTTNKDGVSSEIEFKYCSSCSLKRPETITTTTNMKTDTLTMTIRILSFSSPAFIPPTLFEIE